MVRKASRRMRSSFGEGGRTWIWLSTFSTPRYSSLRLPHRISGWVWSPSRSRLRSLRHQLGIRECRRRRSRVTTGFRVELPYQCAPFQRHSNVDFEHLRRLQLPTAVSITSSFSKYRRFNFPPTTGRWRSPFTQRRILTLLCFGRSGTRNNLYFWDNFA
jgi:hypothetical protein